MGSIGRCWVPRADTPLAVFRCISIGASGLPSSSLTTRADSQFIADVRLVSRLSQVAFSASCSSLCTSHEPAKQIATSGVDRPHRLSRVVLSIRACQHVRYSRTATRLPAQTLSLRSEGSPRQPPVRVRIAGETEPYQVPFLSRASSGGMAIPWIASSRSGSRLRFSTTTSGSVSPSLRSMSIRGGMRVFLDRRGAAE